MAGRFMKIKRVVIPFMTLVVMTSQLAGCATMTSDEMLKSMNESPDVSIEYAIPDPDKQSLDATQVIDIGGQQIVSDSDSGGDIGLIENQDNQEKTELSGDELIRYFQLAYGTSEGIYYLKTFEEKVNFEIEVLSIRAENEGQLLPSNYADQYRAWRPVEEDLADTETEISGETQHQVKPSDKGQQQGQQHTSQNQEPSSGVYDPYDGYGSYEAYINHICEVLPDLSREQILNRFPDPATGEAGPSTANDMEKGLLSG